MKEVRLPLPARRLLTLIEAASYCSVSVPTFERECPVTPISLDSTGRNDKRLLRYDIVSLDEWIDLLSGRLSKAPELTDWGSKVC